jgi:hypothetical protein
VNPEGEQGYRASDDKHRAGSDDKIEVTAAIGGHHEPKRGENTADSDQEEVHGIRPGETAQAERRRAQNASIFM